MVGAGRLLPPGGVKSLRRTGSVPKAYYPRPGADFFLAREQSPPRAGLAASFAPWRRQEPAPDRVCTKSVLSPPRRRLFSCQGTKSAPRRVGSVFCPLAASRACAGPGLYQKRTIPAPAQTFFLPGNKVRPAPGWQRLLPPGGVKSLRRTGSVPKAYYPRAGLAASFAPWRRKSPRRTGSVPKAYYPRPGTDFFLARE